MPVFLFRALTAEGESVSGRIEAVDERGALERLKGRGLIPVRAWPAGRGRWARIATFPHRDRSRLVTSLTRELAVLLGAGERLERALAAIAEGLSDRVASAMLATVRQQVRSGVALSRALAAFPDLFDAAYVAVVAAGEAAGRLPEALGHLAELRERRERFRRQVSAALLYPAVLAIAGLLAIAFILGVVIPELVPLVGERRADLPAAARFVFAASDLLRGRFEMVAGGVLLLALLPLGLRRLPRAAELGDRLALILPGFRTLSRERTSAEFTRGLALLLEGGLDLPNAVRLTRGMVTNRHAARAVAEVARGLREGRRLADCLTEADILAPLALRLLRTGEESGRLQATAAFLAGNLEERVSERLKRLVQLVEPILIVLLGALVAGILGAVLSALLSVNTLAF